MIFGCAWALLSFALLALVVWLTAGVLHLPEALAIALSVIAWLVFLAASIWVSGLAGRGASSDDTTDPA